MERVRKLVLHLKHGSIRPPLLNRMAGPLGLNHSGDAKFLGRWPRLLELLAPWAGDAVESSSIRLSQIHSQEHGSSLKKVSGTLEASENTPEN